MMINVTQSFLPDIELYISYLKKIWDSKQLTNQGTLCLELEEKLKHYLDAEYFLFVNNGTIALQLAIKALELKDEVITTPFSYVATTTSILWEHCTPVFVDISPDSLCMNPSLIEAAITPKTTGILATHVFGNPCEVEAIQNIADRHGLKVIYDGAHAFGVQYKGESIFQYGDISTLSFHATKLFHTAEGGGIVVNESTLHEKLKLLRSFGHVGDDYYSIGINGKNSEFHAAMGLCLLPYISEIIAKRKNISLLYDKFLEGLDIHKQVINMDVTYNYSYYPVIFPSEKILLKVKAALQKNQINARRYFYPSLNQLPYLKRNKCDISEDISLRIMCLPLFPDLSEENVKLISDIISKEMK
jgi:dTDP-4-amino-4,6-dideoxygalactose transaminase